MSPGDRNAYARKDSKNTLALGLVAWWQHANYPGTIYCYWTDPTTGEEVSYTFWKERLDILQMLKRERTLHP